jgi:predicted ATPase
VRSDLPSGTVTFLFTDIEGSTKLLHELGERYVEVRAAHHRAIRTALAAHAGVEVDTQGDAFFAAFARASDAVAAAAEIQRELTAGPTRVRIGVHTGEPTVTDEGYVGVDVHRAARISAAGHGGQVLLSQTTRDLGVSDVRDLGEHRLKDLTPTLRLYQFGAGEFPPLRTLYQTNLPVPPTPFVGRERELREVWGLLRDHRLVTLTGPGGSGKSRLALQAAAEAADDFRDGVWFVPLAAVSDALAVPGEIGRVLNVTRLPDGLRTTQALLLLDNLEHLLEFAPQVAELLSVAPELSILCTSRERLAISAEQEYPVPTLPIDDAVELFAQRARQLRPDFAPDEHVERLVRRLDGLPLAIELAAARTKLLTPLQILERLGGTVDLLGSTMRDAPARQRSLRATLDWSYGLLGPHERRLFGALAVFAGGFSLEAAEEVCEVELDVLQSLVDKSLVGYLAGRCTMLETVREYALEQLRLEGSIEAMRRRHVDYYLPLAEADHDSRIGGRFAEWLEWADVEHGNLREALGYLHESGDSERELRLAAALGDYWSDRGYITEGRQRLEDALARAEGESRAVRAHALNGVTRLSIIQGDHQRALSAGEECLHLQRELGDRVGEAWALLNLAGAYELVDDRDAARTRLQASGALFRELEEWMGVVMYLNNSGKLALVEHDYEQAAALFEEGLALRRRLGWPEGRTLLANLAFALFSQGRHAEAREFFRRGLELSLAVRVKKTATYALEGLAALAAASGGDDSRAARLFGAAAALREETGMPLLGAEALVYGRTLATLRERLGDAGISSALADGRRMSLAAAAAEALSLD